MQTGSVEIGGESREIARRKLREAIAIYGRSAFQEPRRCEAILRDCCPAAPREVFLLVSALRENIAEELIRSDGTLPESALTARLTRRLSEHLGLSDDSARWAVDSWRYGLEGNPGLQAATDGASFALPSGYIPAAIEMGAPTLSFPWLGTCLIALASVFLMLAAVLVVTFLHFWRTWQGGLVECAALSVALALAALGGMLAERAFAQMRPPDRRALDAHKATYALLPEALILCLLPLATAAIPVIWVMGWCLQWHAVGLPHHALFHVIRSLESLAIAIFLYYWARSASRIQVRVAGSFTGRR
jgi:hypothetical protein